MSHRNDRAPIPLEKRLDSPGFKPPIAFMEGSGRNRVA